MASIKRVKHKNGRVVYRIVICLGYDKTGRKRVKNLTCAVDQSVTARQQEKEALKYALEVEEKLKYGYALDIRKELFGEFAGRWLESVKADIAYGTYVGYEQLLRSRILPYFKSYKIANIRTSDVEAFYRTLDDAYAAGTIRRFANVLGCIFETARRWNVIADNPCRGARKPGKKQEKEPLRYFTPSQSVMFLKSLSWTPTQYKVFYALALLCGLRKGETLALKWEDIDLEKREISVTKSVGKTEHGFDYKAPKTPSSVRRIPFSDSVFSLLKEYREEYGRTAQKAGDRWKGEGNLFVQADGKLMGHNTAYQHFARHLGRYNQWVREHPGEARENGLEELPVIPLHGLRHSCATLLNCLDVNIIDISKYLGHANCSTTMNIYAHSFEKQKRAACDRLDLFLRENL